MTKILPLLPFLLSILRTLLELGGNLDDTTLFGARQSSAGLGLNVLQETSWDFGTGLVFLETNISWVLQGGLRRLVQEGYNEPIIFDLQSLVEKSHITPRVLRGWTRDIVTCSERRLMAGPLYYDSGHNPDVLSWFESWAAHGFVGIFTSIKSLEGGHGQSCESTNCAGNRHCWDLREVVEEINETGTRTTLKELLADWLARDLIWRRDDPRVVIPVWE